MVTNETNVSAYDGGQSYHIDFESNDIPIVVRFNTKPTEIETIQTHHPSPGKTQHMVTVEKPDRLIHQVNKPVIQYIHEMIVPYRRHVQVVEPVREILETHIATSAFPSKHSRRPSRDFLPLYSESRPKNRKLPYRKSAPLTGSEILSNYVPLKERITFSKQIEASKPTAVEEEAEMDRELSKIIAFLIENSDKDTRKRLKVNVA